MLFRTVLAVASFCLPAMSQPNLSGTWKLNLQKSDYGPDYRVPARQTNTIEHNDPKLKITQDEEYATGSPVHGTAEYRTDGQESTNDVMGNVMKAVAKWEGETLRIETRGDFNGMPIYLDDRWSLSADRRTLTLKRHFEGHNRTADQTILFDRE